MGTGGLRMLDDKTVERFLRILGGTSELRTEHASVLVDFIASRNEEDQVELVRILVESYGDPETASGERFAGRKMSDSQFQKLGQTLEGMVDGTIKMIIHTRKTPSEAARLLRDLVFSFDEDEYRDYILYSIMADLAIPYVPVPEADFAEFSPQKLEVVARRHRDKVYQLNSIVRGGFGSTVTSNLILRVIEEAEPLEDRVGLMELLLNSIVALTSQGNP
jgi:hypothetical protein